MSELQDNIDFIIDLLNDLDAFLHLNIKKITDIDQTSMLVELYPKLSDEFTLNGWKITDHGYNWYTFTVIEKTKPKLPLLETEKL